MLDMGIYLEVKKRGHVFSRGFLLIDKCAGVCNLGIDIFRRKSQRRGKSKPQIPMSKKSLLLPVAVACGLLANGFFNPPLRAFDEPVAKFDFGSGPATTGFKRVAPTDVYSKERGYGFEPGSTVTAHGGCVTSDKPFLFSVVLPDGDYNVTATFGDDKGDSVTTVKAEARRLMLEKIHTDAGKTETRTFTVNVRSTKIATGGVVNINKRESGPPLVAHWDEKLTLEFNNTKPCLRSLQIDKAPGAITVFLAGDSTVTDQPHEPWAGWGQMLPRFFKPGVAISNHAESGLALYSFRGQRRLDKITGDMKKGDYLFIQFGHNDQKNKAPGAGAFTTYKTDLKQFVAAARAHGGIPVLVTPMERRRFDPQGKPTPTLADYAEAVRQVGKEDNVPVIDLNAMSLKFYEALGPENSKKAFVHYPAGSFPGQDKELKDDTHHNAYGGYELAKCMVEGIKANVPALAKFLVDDVPAFDPSHPDPAASFDVPASASAAAEKPAGN
jgi:lysophospholipase L1-like esterase